MENSEHPFKLSGAKVCVAYFIELPFTYIQIQAIPILQAYYFSWDMILVSLPQFTKRYRYIIMHVPEWYG